MTSLLSFVATRAKRVGRADADLDLTDGLGGRRYEAGSCRSPGRSLSVTEVATLRGPGVRGDDRRSLAWGERMDEGMGMDLHLSIDGDSFFGIDVDLHVDGEVGSRAPELTCRHLTFEEDGGEGFGARRDVASYPVSADTLAELRRLLPARPLPVPASPLFGVDGTTYTLTIGRGAGAVEYSWWVQLPAEWECLGEIVRILVAGARLTEVVDRSLCGGGS